MPSFSLMACLRAQLLSHARLRNLMDCSQRGSSVHGVFQARILEQVAISSSRGSFQTRELTRDSRVSCTGGWVLYHCATWEALDVTVVV